MTTNDLIVDVLMKLVESVADQPRRALFRGVSDLSEYFRARAMQEGRDWEVMVTRADVDVVGARNDTAIGTLVVFYRDEVRERESLNAFRQFDEDAIAEALVRAAEASALPDTYSSDEIERLRRLLALAYPAIEQLAEFLLAGKDNVGRVLPLLGLFRDSHLNYSWDTRRWQARIEDNHMTAVLRWREFLEKGGHNRDARHLLGDERVALLGRADTDPAAKQVVLEKVEYLDALRILNPPTQLVLALMDHGLRREEAERAVSDVKAGRLDHRTQPIGTSPLPEPLIAALERIKPTADSGDDKSSPDPDVPRLRFCLEALLRLAHDLAPLPTQLYIARTDDENGHFAELSLVQGGQWHVLLGAEATRALSTPAAGASELRFHLFRPDQPDKILLRFSLENLMGRLESYTEMWPDADFWDRAAGLDPQHQHVWRRLQDRVGQVQKIVDPNWRAGQEDEDVISEKEPNNSIYALFDLVYLAHRNLFEDFFDAWLEAATLPWRANVAARPDDWRWVVEGLLNLGLSAQSDGIVAVLPFYPLRMAWHRAVFAQIEHWLAGATQAGEPLAFEPTVLSEQFQIVDRPRVLIHHDRRLVEVSSAPFFSLFVPEERRQRARAPLDRARQKLEQFGHMWPFSLNRLHLAFQPGDISDDVYRLLVQLVEDREAAFRVRAIVDNAGIITQFDRRLFTTGDETTDLLTQEYHEGLLPLVDYAKGRLDESEDDQEPVAAHAALLVDVFREEKYGFDPIVGRLNNQPHWTEFSRLATADEGDARQQFKQVYLSAPPYHSGSIQNGQRDLVYVPLNGDQPEFLRLLIDSLCAWVTRGAFAPGAAYYERVRWDAQALEYLHSRADWVILFDRTLDKSLFKQLAPAGIRLIDFYPNLRGGYRLSVSSRRTDAVEWQLVQVLQQFFGDSSLDLHQTAGEMIETLVEFASGLLLKTLGGGSLAQELLGLYATYRALVAEGEFVPGRDWLIPLDNYQSWFGRRTQRGRRADLLVLRSPSPACLEMLAVESKWYKQMVGVSFVGDEFGPQGQLRTATRSLHSLFDPQQKRLDRDYWQRALYSLLEEAPAGWKPFRNDFQRAEWDLRVDGLVYVHQYGEHDVQKIAQRSKELEQGVGRQITPQDLAYFSLGQNFSRLRLESYPELVELLGGAS